MNDIKNKIFCGNVINVLKEFPAESIDLVCTSPPYWSLRNYGTQKVDWKDGWNGELGQEPNPQMFVEHLCDVFDEIKRVLKSTGSLYINLDDTYAGSMQAHGSTKASESGFEKALPERDYLISSSTKPPCADCGITKKSMCLVPERFVVEMVNRDWVLRNKIIWHKINGKPESVKDRFTRDFEPLYLFTKSPKYYFNQILEPLAPSTLVRVNHDIKSDKSKEYGVSNEHMLKWSEKVKMGMITGKNKRTVWEVPVEHAYSTEDGEHHAVFPQSLIEPMILASCPENGIVLDPFFGTGTVGVVAKKFGRNYVGIDISEKYCKIAKARLDEKQKGLGDFE